MKKQLKLQVILSTVNGSTYVIDTISTDVTNKYPVQGHCVAQRESISWTRNGMLNASGETSEHDLNDESKEMVITFYNDLEKELSEKIDIMNYSSFELAYIPDDMKGFNHNSFKTVYAYKAGETVFKGSIDEWNDSKGALEYTSHETITNDSAKKKYTEKKRIFNDYIFNTWKQKVFEYVGADITKDSHLSLWGAVYADVDSVSSDMVNSFSEYFEKLESHLK